MYLKRCTVCQIEKPLEEFGQSRNSFDGHHYRCIACHRESNRQYREKIGAQGRRKWRDANPGKASRYAKSVARSTKLLKLYGMSPQDWWWLLEIQDYRCGICKKPFKDITPSAIHTDHDHLTGNVRGLLCPGCNKGLGMFRDEPDALLAAAQWVIAAPVFLPAKPPRRYRHVVRIGERFGRLVVVGSSFSEGTPPIRKVECVCDCGNRGVFQVARLGRGTTRSCGCYRNDLLVEQARKRNAARPKSSKPVKLGNRRMLICFGETKSMADWARDERCVVSYFVLNRRISYLQWGDEEAITRPADPRKVRR